MTEAQISEVPVESTEVTRADPITQRLREGLGGSLVITGIVGGAAAMLGGLQVGAQWAIACESAIAGVMVSFASEDRAARFRDEGKTTRAFVELLKSRAESAVSLAISGASLGIGEGLEGALKGAAVGVSIGVLGWGANKLVRRARP